MRHSKLDVHGAGQLWCFCSRWMVRRQDSKSSYRLFIPIPTIIRQFIWQISRRQSAAPQWIH